jgi:predicted nucleic acid-binding protein
MEAKRAVEQIARRKNVPIIPTRAIHSVETSDRDRIGFWEALIAKAATARCSILPTEELHHLHVIPGIRIKSPFA